MSADLIALALLMGAVTYPSRAVPLLVPGIERLPPAALAYLRLVGPAVLASLAAVNVLVRVDAAGTPSVTLGIEAAAVAVCLGIVVRRRNLFVGLLAAVVLVAAVRAVGG